MTTTHPLVEAFHAVYDVKDAHHSNEYVRVLGYETLSRIKDLMIHLDIEVPRRYDKEGR
jgi:hypothetical protein